MLLMKNEVKVEKVDKNKAGHFNKSCTAEALREVGKKLFQIDKAARNIKVTLVCNPRTFHTQIVCVETCTIYHYLGAKRAGKSSPCRTQRFSFDV